MIRFVSSVANVPRPGEVVATSIPPRFAGPANEEVFESSSAARLDSVRQHTCISGVQPSRNWWGLGPLQMPTLQQSLQQGITLSSPLLGPAAQAIHFGLGGEDERPKAEIQGKACSISSYSPSSLVAQLPDGRSLTIHQGGDDYRFQLSSPGPQGYSVGFELTPGQTTPHSTTMSVAFKMAEHNEHGIDRVRVAAGQAAEVSRSSLFEATPCEEVLLPGRATEGTRARLGREIDAHLMGVLVSMFDQGEPPSLS